MCVQELAMAGWLAAHPFLALQEGSVQSKAGRGETREDKPEAWPGELPVPARTSSIIVIFVKQGIT